jgi:dihydrofolate reductase
MEIVLIAAVAKNGIIGKDNDLVWKLPDDMKFFKDITVGFPVIMGRKNYESIPKKFRPLEARQNIILTRNKDYTAEGAFVVHTLSGAFELASSYGKGKAFIIGGAEIYKLALDANAVDTMWITEVDALPEGNVLFPWFDKRLWKEEKISEHPADERHQYAFSLKKFTCF